LTLLGRYIDHISAANNGDIHSGTFNVAVVQFTILMAVVIAASFIPTGSFALSPRMLNDENLEDLQASTLGEEEFPSEVFDKEKEKENKEESKD
jgi:hypothetical protein